MADETSISGDEGEALKPLDEDGSTPESEEAADEEEWEEDEEWEELSEWDEDEFADPRTGRRGSGPFAKITKHRRELDEMEARHEKERHSMKSRHEREREEMRQRRRRERENFDCESGDPEDRD